eukprot:Selendium_serpulae@DN4793_c0_g1_i6.p3
MFAQKKYYNSYCVDERDPNYNSESDEAGVEYTCYIPPITVQQFTDAVTPEINEFFRITESGETVSALQSLGHPEYHDLLVVLFVKKALDRSDEVQRATAELLTVLVDAHVVSKQQLAWGFEKLIQTAENLYTDVPDVYDRLMSFFDCAIDDQLIPPNFYWTLPEQFLDQVSPSSEHADKLSEVKKRPEGI